MAEKKVNKRKLFIPKDPINKNSHVYVSVNDEEYYLATGKTVEVPEHIAEAYEYSYGATAEAYERIQADNEIH